MKTLYEMTKDFCELQEMLEENSDDVSITDTLEAVQLNFEQKVLNIVSLVKNINIPVDSIDQEIKRLQAHKNAIKNNTQRLKDYLRDSMLETGINEIKNDLVKIKLQKAAPGLNILDIDSIPENLKETKIEIKPKTNEIKKLLKTGDPVAGCELKEPTKFVKFY